MVKCSTCGATYDTISADGVPYYHACPPLAGWEIRAAIDAGKTPLTAAQLKTLAAADHPPVDPTTQKAPPATGDTYLTTLAIPRPNARNENIDPVKVKAARDPQTGNVPDSIDPAALMLSVGAGVIEVADAAVLA